METFKQLDDRFGGGHARPALIQYLSSDRDRLLRGRYTEAVGSVLFSSVAEATLLAAWMSYDAAPRSALAQRYFIQALSLAHAGRDRLLGAGILDAMSHQPHLHRPVHRGGKPRPGRPDRHDRDRHGHLDGALSHDGGAGAGPAG